MLSIVIPTKNEAAYLPRLLESIRRQTVQPSEIIVADADSQDETCRIAKRFGVRIVKGGMPAAGRNQGAARAQHDLILFLDADVELRDPEFLEKSVGEMLERRLDLATCDVFPLSDDFLDHFLHKAYNVYVRAWGNAFPHAPGFCLFVQRAAHQRIGGFDETIRLAEDMDYARRLSRVGTFGFLRSTKIPVSIRRLDRDGRLNIAIKYLLGELHMVTLGPIRHDQFHYTFEHPTREKQKIL